MDKTFLTTDELSGKIKYKTRTINECLKDSVLIEGRHYFRPFGGRKILWIWETICEDMFANELDSSFAIPLASGGICNG